MKITNKVKMLMASLAAVLMLGVTALPVSAAKVFCPDGTESINDSLEGCGTNHGINNANNKNNLMETVGTVINVITGIVGFIAVVVLIYGGVQYTLSTGDSAKVKRAKDTIMYGIIGLVIAILACAIVNFVWTTLLK